jgi:hypothetical protein
MKFGSDPMHAAAVFLMTSLTDDSRPEMPNSLMPEVSDRLAATRRGNWPGKCQRYPPPEES